MEKNDYELERERRIEANKRKIQVRGAAGAFGSPLGGAG